MLQRTCLCSDLRGGEITQAAYFIFIFLEVCTRAHASPWVLHSQLKPTPSVFAESSPGGLRCAALRVCALGGTERCLEQHPFLGKHTNTLGGDLRMRESAVRGALA